MKMAGKNKSNRKNRKVSSKNMNMRKIDSGWLDPEIWGKIFVVLAVLVVLGLFYLLTLYITNKNSDKSDNDEKTKEETVISYNDIILGESFSMSDDDYLVIYYDESDEDVKSTYDGLISSYKGKEDALSIYSVDMSSAFNKKYITTEESNKNPNNASELLINGPTLIHFIGQSVNEYIEGEEAITSYLS